MEDQTPLEGEKLLETIALKLKTKPEHVEESLTLIEPIIMGLIHLQEVINKIKPIVRCAVAKDRKNVNVLIAALLRCSDDFKNIKTPSNFKIDNPDIMEVVDNAEPLFMTGMKLFHWFKKDMVDLTCSNAYDVPVLQSAIDDLQDVHIKKFMEFSEKIRIEEQTTPPKQISVEEFEQIAEDCSRDAKHDPQRGTISIPNTRGGG